MTERIGDLPNPGGWSNKKSMGIPCRHPEHNPPSHMVWEPGRYRHTCPGCGKVTEFNVYPREMIG